MLRGGTAEGAPWPRDGSERTTHCLRDGEDLPAGGVDGDESRGQQLLPLRAVASAGVHYLIHADLEPKNAELGYDHLGKGVTRSVDAPSSKRTWQKWCLLNASVA